MVTFYETLFLSPFATLYAFFVLYLAKFYQEVYEILQKDDRTDIFVKGSADITGDNDFRAVIEDTSCQSESFLDIFIYPLVDKSLNRYGRTPIAETTISKEYYINRDLPNLRARFVQCKLKEAYVNLKPKILQGSVVPESGEKLRNVSLILFVPYL